MGQFDHNHLDELIKQVESFNIDQGFCAICGNKPFVLKEVAGGWLSVCRDCFGELEPMLDRLRESS